MDDLILKTHPDSPLRYLFVRPKYPLLCCVEDEVFGAKSEKQFIQQIARYTFAPEAEIGVISVTGAHWAFYPDRMLLSPFISHNRWTKLQLIRLVNNRSNKSDPEEVPYSERGLGSKRFSQIFHDLVAMTGPGRNASPRLSGQQE